MKSYFRNGQHKSVAIFFLAIIVIVNSSCSKFLDATPKDVVLDKNFPKDFWDAEFMLRGAYQAMQPLVEYKFILGEMRGDWVKPGTGADNDILELSNHTVTDVNRYTDWKPFYDLVNRSNYVVKNVPRVPLDSNNFSLFKRNQYIGEARFLRSWAYFHLIENFDAVPFMFDPVDDISKVPYLAPTAQNIILDSLEADLILSAAATDVQIWVPNSFDAGQRISPEQSRLRVRKQAVYGLLAEVYLWRNKYAEAAAACQSYYNIGIDVSPLNSNADWIKIFYGGSSDLFNEQLFQVDFSFAARETNNMMMLTSNDPASGGKYMVAPSDVAIKTFHPDYPIISTSNLRDEIYRGFGASFVGSAPYYNRLNSNPVIWKYLTLGAVKAATVDVPANVKAPYQSDQRFHVYREADLYLLWAEALNRLGNKATAITRINSIRGRGGMPAPGTASPVYDSISVNSSTDKIEKFILRERGIELGFEGRRWYDLMRIARHRGTPSSPDVTYVVDAVKKRIPSAQQLYIDVYLANIKNWYLPYNKEEKKLNPYLK